MSKLKNDIQEIKEDLKSLSDNQSMNKKYLTNREKKLRAQDNITKVITKKKQIQISKKKKTKLKKKIIRLYDIRKQRK